MRSSIQPQRRNSALYRKYEDLILWLKFENNFDDSSYYDQQVIGFNPNVIPTQIDLPPFDDTTYVVSPIDRKYTTYFEGTSLDKYSAAFNTKGGYTLPQSLLVSGSGVFTADPQEDSALQMNINSNSDFTFEFWAKHKYIPKGEDDDPGVTYFDFGSLKFTNTSGVFSVHTPAGDQWDYYDRNFLLGLGNGAGRQGTTYKYHSVPTHASHSACFFTDQYISTSSNWPANLLYHTVSVDEGMLVIDINKQINITQDFYGYASSAPTNSTIEITLRKNGGIVSTFSKDVGTIDVGESCHITNFEGIHFIEVKKGDIITATSEQGAWWAFHFEVLEVDNASGPNLTNTFTHYAVQRRNNFIELWMGHKNLDGSDSQFKLVEAFEEPDDPEDPQRMNSYDVTGLSKVLLGEGPYFENWVAPYHDSRAIGSTISGTNFFTGWMDEFKVWGEAIYGPGSINPNGPYAVGVWCEETRRQFDVEMSSYDIKRAQPQRYHPPIFYEKYIYENSSCFLWCQVATEYDARYSLHEPLPCHVEWYGTRHGLLGKSTTAEWQPNPGTNSAKYVVGALGYHELIINNFVKDDEDIYYAVVKIGDPKRPKYTYRYYQDGITPIKLHLKYRGVISCFSEGTKITLSDQSEKSIEDIKVGDKVLSINEKTFEAEEDKVLEITSPVHDDMIRINFDQDIENKNTFDHPYYVKNKGLASYNPRHTKERYGLDANQLEEGDVCYLYENGKFKETKIISITEELGNVQTYNLHKIEKNHNFLANGILVHNKSPIPALYWTMYNCPYTTVSLGQTITLFVTMWRPGWNWNYPPLSLLPTHPSDIRWTNKGRGLQIDYGDAWHSGTLTFKNVRKGIKGPICAELTDSNGLSWGLACCNGIFLKLPNLACPLITSATPDKSTNKFDMTPCPGKPQTVLCHGRGNWFGYRKCLMYSQMMILEGSTSLSQKFTITAGDPNVSELQTGGLEYKWGIYGSQEIADVWTVVNQADTNFGSDTSRTYSFLERFHGYVYCEVKYKNYPYGDANPSWALDPEGRAQRGVSTVMYWYVNFPECKEPTLMWHPPQLTSQGRADYFNRYYGRTYVQNTVDLGKGKELGSSTRKIRCPSCTTALIPYSYLGNQTKWDYTKKRYPYWLSNRGFTKSISYSGTSPGYDTIAIAAATSRWLYYGYWDRGETDYLWKTVYLNDNKKTFIIRADNDCGGMQLEYVFDIYKMPAPRLWTQNLGSWNYQRYWWYYNWNTWDGAEVNFYYQELDWFNWQTNKVESYYKRWPTTPQRHRTFIHGVAIGCAGYRIKVNGQLVQNWKEIPASYTSKSVSFADAGSQWGWWYGTRHPLMLVTFDNNRANWGQDKNTVVIEVSNNLPAKGQYDQGDIGKFTWNVNFNTLPKITTPTTWPRWGWWYCGYYYWGWWSYYRRAYWWWRPYCYWYNPQHGGWIKKQTSFVTPSNNSVPTRRSLRGSRTAGTLTPMTP